LRAFAVVAPKPAANAFAGALLSLCVAGAVVAWLQTGQHASMPASAWIVMASLTLVAVLVFLLLQRRSVALDSDVLVIKAGLNTRRVAVSALDLARARIVDLDERTELKPSRKTFGSSLPGYQTGRFRTHKWGKGFYLLTDRRRVLWLPERDGLHLLLSLQQPQALLSALNAMAQPVRAR